MMAEFQGESAANHDVGARLAIWNSICICADDVRRRFDVESIQGTGGHEIRGGGAVPAVATWQLIEALSLLCVILRCDDAAADVVTVFGKVGPVQIREEGVALHLWTQQTLRGGKSALTGRPDIIVTSTADLPHPGNAARIIEAKCVKQLGTQTI
jgi:hypothetical protein